MLTSHQFIGLGLIIVSSVASCVPEGCDCVDKACTIIECGEAAGDEIGGEEDCGWMANDRGIVVMVSACSVLGQKIKNEIGFVPLTQDAQCKPAREWDCAAIFETVDVPFTEPVRCGYCEEYDYTDFAGPVGIQPAPGDAMTLCYPPATEWEAATLQGRIGPPTSVTGSACEWVEPPIGYDTEYAELASCSRGVSCLYIDDGCGCKCRDPNGNDEGWPYISDYFGALLVNGWEMTCSGEPLVWQFASQEFVGSTVEPDGWEPNFPPNNEAVP